MIRILAYLRHDPVHLCVGLLISNWFNHQSFLFYHSEPTWLALFSDTPDLTKQPNEIMVVFD